MPQPIVQNAAPSSPRAPELEPGVAEPLVVGVLAAEQQVPLHPLVRVGVGLDAVGGEVAVEQERKRQREHLRLAGAVVAAQQQPPVAERELLAVVVEEIDQPQPQRLPALARRVLGSARRSRRSAGAISASAASAPPARSAPSAGSGWTASPARRMRRSAASRSSACSTSPTSAPGSRVLRRQYARCSLRQPAHERVQLARPGSRCRRRLRAPPGTR